MRRDLTYARRGHNYIRRITTRLPARLNMFIKGTLRGDDGVRLAHVDARVALVALLALLACISRMRFRYVEPMAPPSVNVHVIMPTTRVRM